MMTTSEIESYMLSDPYIRCCYGGVLPSNELPTHIVRNKPKLYVVNTQKSNQRGQHWIAIYLNANEPEYFDSLGNIPLKEFEDFLILNGPHYLRNMKQVQAINSNLCGLFCLFFAYFRTRGVEMQDILNMFKKDYAFNDLLVKFFYQYTCI